MTALGELQTQLARLKAARATGAKRIIFGNGATQREVEYRDDKSLIAAIAALEDEIAAMQGTARQRTVKIVSSKGY